MSTSGEPTEGRVGARAVAVALLVLGVPGAVPGAAVTALFWLVPVGERVAWLAFVLIAVGFVVGAIIGAAVGSGLVKEVWHGPLHAFLITTVVIALLNVILLIAVAPRD